MKPEITIVSINDPPENPSDPVVVKTKMFGLGGTVNVSRDRFDLFKKHVGTTISFEEFSKLCTDPTFK